MGDGTVTIPSWLIGAIGFIIVTGFSVIGYLIQKKQSREELKDAALETKLDKVLEGIEGLNMRMTRLEANTDHWKEQQNMNTLKIADLEKWQTKQESKLATIMEWKEQTTKKIVS